MGRGKNGDSYRRYGVVVILDGGMGHLLRRNGVNISGPIGTMERFRSVARANQDAPDIVRQSHLQFLRSGADVITTNTYACVPAAFATDGGGFPDDIVELIEAGGALAARAQDIAVSEGLSQARPLVAGCLPPLHESYRADRVGDYHELASTYRVIVDAIAPSSDLLLCETMHSTAEAFAAAEAANEAGLPVWVSFTVSEVDVGNLRSGEAIAEGVAAIDDFPNVEAVMLNCSSPEAITSALPLLVQAAPDLTTGVYANGFSDEFRATAADDDSVPTYREYNEMLTPDAFARMADDWRRQGASIIGGCCGIFPEHIASVVSTTAAS